MISRGIWRFVYAKTLSMVLISGLRDRMQSCFSVVERGRRVLSLVSS